MAKREKLTAAAANAAVTKRIRKRAFRLLRSELKGAAASLEVLRSNSMRAPRDIALNRWARTKHAVVTQVLEQSREMEGTDAP